MSAGAAGVPGRPAAGLPPRPAPDGLEPGGQAPEGPSLDGRHPRVLLAGAFGQGNPGDESVLDAFVAGLPGCRLTATTARPGGVPPAGRRSTGRRSTGLWPSSGAAYATVAPGDRLAVARAALRADLTVATATVFKTLPASSGRSPLSLLGSTLGLALATRAAGRPLAMVGVGAGALAEHGARALARGVAATAGTIEVRDEESADALAGAGVRRVLPVGADVTWAVLPDPPQPARRPARVVVALSHLAGGPELFSEIGAALRLLAGHGLSVAVQPWQADLDLPVAQALRRHVGPTCELWDPPLRVPEAAACFADAGVVLGLRFHSLVAAAAAGRPFTALTHEPKLAGLARRFDQEATPPWVTGPELAAATLRAFEGPAPTPTAVRRERTAALDTMARLCALAFQRAGQRGLDSR